MTRGTGTAVQHVRVMQLRLCVCELATILILFVQTDPVPFYFQLVENKLVLFLLSVAMTTQPFLFPLFPLLFLYGGSNEVKGKKASFFVDETFLRFFYHLYSR